MRGRGRAKRHDDVPSTERDIARLLIAKDPRAIEMAYDLWGEVTYGIALALVGSPAVAESIVQQAYLALWTEPRATHEYHVGLERALLGRVVRAAHDVHYGAPTSMPDAGNGR